MIAGLRSRRKPEHRPQDNGARDNRPGRIVPALAGSIPAMPPATRPPPVDPLVAMADRCVQCGLCLPACPTYGHDRIESESPRGRIALMRAWALDTIEPTPVGEVHLDHCLGCRRCEAVCPAGVKYDELLVLGRNRQRERRGAGLRQRLVEAMTTRPRLLRGSLKMYRYMHPWLPPSWRPIPRPPAANPTPAVPASAMSSISALSPVSLFVGCVAEPYEAITRDGLRRLCATLGIDLSTPLHQVCCGSLHAHAGNVAAAERLAARNRSGFGDAKTVLTLASGCHDTVARSLPGISTLDALVFLDIHADRLRFRPHQERVALHLPCTQRMTAAAVPALRRLLARIPGLQVVELTDGYGCCGAAGTQMITDPDRAREYRQPLLAQLHASGATRLLSANIGCRLHLGNGTDLAVLHPVDFLAQLLEAAHAPVDHSGPIELLP